MEMLIACMYPVMKTYCLKGGMIGYKGDVFNIGQDIGGLVSSLPQRIDQLSTMIVQKQNTNVTVGYKTSEFDIKQYNSGLPFFIQTTH
eukprot:3835116-Ditylum_brightwellii.AAC.1